MGRGAKGIEVNQLPYKVTVYINGQVLIPANLVKRLKLGGASYARITIAYQGRKIVIDRAKLLRTRHTFSRQFTLPKRIRMETGIKPGDILEVLDIRAVS
ncbi:MAG: AbrB family transcriptional regulator [Thermofilum sp. ex4484_15]|nr:MAG: AbrB family transcriptional regulator [Thermofilum sp. ex4484_15]